MTEKPVTASAIVWFRQDLRIEDHPALTAAAAGGLPVVPVFVWSPQEEGEWAPGAASRWWWHGALRDLASQLAACGSRLILRRGATAGAELLAVAGQVNARVIHWTRRLEPDAITRDLRLQARLEAAGMEVRMADGACLHDPHHLRTGAGGPYQVFTPFWRRLQAAGPPRRPLPAPRRLTAPPAWPAGVALDALDLLPRVDWAGGLREAWRPGAAGAREALAGFARDGQAHYAARRDALARDGTSRLSPYLHTGELSPFQVWHAVAAEPYRRQLAWREFAHHLLVHFPRTPAEPLRPDYGRFPWRDDPAAQRAWERGRTGYPIVDAAMRQLWCTGWMHNRARMIVASFLVKDLLIPWQAGARWFWDTLVDADLANNTLGWQWAAGCGADAAPYFRIFNPVRQGETFDPQGAYVRAHLPELARLPDRWVHRPWEAPPALLAAAGVVLGRDYPAPIVDHAAARLRALQALKQMQASAPTSSPAPPATARGAR